MAVSPSPLATTTRRARTLLHRTRHLLQPMRLPLSRRIRQQTRRVGRTTSDPLTPMQQRSPLSRASHLSASLALPQKRPTRPHRSHSTLPTTRQRSLVKTAKRIQSPRHLPPSPLHPQRSLPKTLLPPPCLDLQHLLRPSPTVSRQRRRQHQQRRKSLA